MVRPRGPAEVRAVSRASRQPMRKTRSLRLKAALEQVPEAIDCVTRSAQAAGFDERTVHKIQVAVDEACANVIEHAYAGMSDGYMEISCCLDGCSFIVRVRDWGRRFDPNAVEEPDIDAPLEERTLGGLGLYLIRQYMDHAQFSFDPEQGNELVMVKRLQVAEQSGQGDQ
jgi:serine/threonine-protein kinase RsbW